MDFQDFPMILGNLSVETDHPPRCVQVYTHPPLGHTGLLSEGHNATQVSGPAKTSRGARTECRSVGVPLLNKLKPTWIPRCQRVPGSAVYDKRALKRGYKDASRFIQTWIQGLVKPDVDKKIPIARSQGCSPSISGVVHKGVLHYWSRAAR